MPIRVSESEIQRLARLNRRVVRKLGRDFIGGINLESPGRNLSSFDPEHLFVALGKKSRKWADRNISRTYRAAVRSTEKKLRSSGMFVADRALDKRFSGIHEDSINNLMDGPVVGFMAGVGRASAEVRNRVNLIKSQLKSLAVQQETIRESIARVGLLGKDNLNSIRDGIVNELIGADKAAAQVLRNKFKMMGPQNLFSNISNVSFITFPDGKGGIRHIRMDRYMEDLGRIKAAQSITMATRNTLLRHGHELIQISSTKSRDGDFCDLFSGKVFALTKEASIRWGVPHVTRLPNGGAPFHPNCRHVELPYFHREVNKKKRQKDMAPPPSWALDAPMGRVQSIYLGARKQPRGARIKKRPIGAEIANWDHRVLERMMGEPIGKVSVNKKTFAGSVKRSLSKRGVRGIGDVLLLGGFLNEELRGAFLRKIGRSEDHLKDFKTSIRSVFTQYRNRRAGEFFPDSKASDFLAQAIEEFDAYQGIRENFDEATQEKSVSVLTQVRSMGAGAAREAAQNWTEGTPLSLKKDFNRTAAYFPTPWLLKSKKEGPIKIVPERVNKDFGYSYYHRAGAKMGLFSIAAIHSNLRSPERLGIFLYLMALRIKDSVPELRAFEKEFWDRLGPREKEEMLELLGYASTSDGSEEPPELFAAGVAAVFGYNTDGLSNEKLISFVLGTYAGVP